MLLIEKNLLHDIAAIDDQRIFTIGINSHIS